MTDNLSSCCQARMFMDDLTAVPEQVVFGKIARCVQCRGFKGEARIAYTAPKAYAAAWNGTSHALMVDVYGKRKWSPMRFTLRGTALVPEGTPAQQELEDAPPF